MSSIPAIAILGTNPRFQSPYVYLQAAGSDGSDATSIGIDLRWTLLRSLGELHLPKGDFAAPGGPFETTTGFNRADDYVRIYRSPYSNKLHGGHVRLADLGKTVFETGASRRWRFSTRPIAQAEDVTTTLELRFTDVLLYDFVRASVNPATAPLEFLRRYTGRIEMEALGKHLLSICVSFEPHVTDPSFAGPLASGEAISTRNRFAPPDLYVSCRHRLPAANLPRALCFTCEDMRHIRFRYVNSFPFMVDIQTYEDYILGTFLHQGIKWLAVGRFSLMLDDTAVESALRNAPHHDVDKRWPKYNEADPVAGGFVVSTANYLDRWSQPEGLKHAVTRYLELSRVDPRAVEVLTDATTLPNEATIQNSYLDSLNIVAQDFHIARMLGLGHIDADPTTIEDQWVYLAEYVTERALEPFGADTVVTHYAMTMPVSRTDHRLPLAPILRPPRYGLFHQPIENEPPHLLSDPNGYSLTEPSRWINLDREPFPWEGPLPPFSAGDPDYCFCTASAPALYGVEYRKLGEPAFRRPEISHDEIYQDGVGIFETNGVLELEQNPVYTHRETAEGVHQYALYAINWFSRVSPLSNIITTDDTRFPVARNLKPPGSFAVQLVQKEEPLIFTTANEQDHARCASWARQDPRAGDLRVGPGAQHRLPVRRSGGAVFPRRPAGDDSRSGGHEHRSARQSPRARDHRTADHCQRRSARGSPAVPAAGGESALRRRQLRQRRPRVRHPRHRVPRSLREQPVLHRESDPRDVDGRGTRAGRADHPGGLRRPVHAGPAVHGRREPEPSRELGREARPRGLRRAVPRGLDGARRRLRAERPRVHHRLRRFCPVVRRSSSCARKSPPRTHRWGTCAIAVARASSPPIPPPRRSA